MGEWSGRHNVMGVENGEGNYNLRMEVNSRPRKGEEMNCPLEFLESSAAPPTPGFSPRETRVGFLNCRTVELYDNKFVF